MTTSNQATHKTGSHIAAADKTYFICFHDLRYVDNDKKYFTLYKVYAINHKTFPIDCAIKNDKLTHHDRYYLH
jgi:hypothetical protein